MCSLKGNQFEIFFALELLAHLSFCKEIQYDLNKLENSGLIDTLNKLFKLDLETFQTRNEKELHKHIKHCIQQIKWNLVVKQQTVSFRQC